MAPLGQVRHIISTEALYSHGVSILEKEARSGALLQQGFGSPNPAMKISHADAAEDIMVGSDDAAQDALACGRAWNCCIARLPDKTLHLSELPCARLGPAFSATSRQGGVLV